MSLRTARFAASLALVALAGCGSNNGGDGLTLDKTSLSFSADGNGPLPAPQSIHVTVSHSDAAFVVAGYPPGTTVPSWLALSFTGSGTSWNLQASIVSTAFAGGSYSVTVRVAIARQDESVIAYRDAQVTYTVANGLTATPSPLAFAQVTGGPQPPSQSIALGGGSGTAWTASANQPWVLLSAASGTTPSIVNVSVNAAGLAAGSYNARITFSTSGRTADVDVSLSLTAPGLQAGQATLLFDGINGAPIASKPLGISMNNGTAASWIAASNAGWLFLDKTSGTTPATVTVSVDPAVGPLASGTYHSTVTFTSPALPPVSVDVTLTLTKASFSFNPSPLVLGGANGKDLGAKQVLLALDTGSKAYAWTATPGTTWMSLSSPSGTTSASGATIDVTPDRTGLAGGTRTGTVTFAATVNGDTVSASMPVTFNLEAHRLLVARNGVALTKTPGSSILTRTVQVADNLGAAAPWTASPDQGWLSVTASGTGSGDLVLTADPTGLAVGSLNLASVTLATTDATVEQTDVVRVGLWVDSATTGPVAVSGSFTELVADPVRPFVYVHDGGTSVSAYNVHTGALVAAINNVAAGLGAMAVASDGSTLFAIDRTAFEVVPVNLATNAVGTAWSLVTTANSYPMLAYMRTDGVPILAVTDGAIHDAAAGNAILTFLQPSQVSPIILVTASLGGTAFCAGICHSLSYSSLFGGSWAMGALRGSSGARDMALAADGAHVYGARGDVYNCFSEDTATGQSLAFGSNYPYPGNVEVGPEGRIYCGRYAAVIPSEGDVFVFDPAGTQLGTVRISEPNTLGLLDRQLAISGDGLRVAGLDPALKIVTAP